MQALRFRTPIPELTRAMLDNRASDIEALCLDAFGAHSRTAICSDLLMPALNELGDLWYRGSISHREYLAAAGLAEKVAAGLPPTPSTSPVPRGALAMLAGFERDPHPATPLMLALALEDDGWQTLHLGSGLPVHALVTAAAENLPDLVCLSVGVLDSAAVRRAVLGIHGQGASVLLGGPAFERRAELAASLGADGVATDPRMTAVQARRLLRA